MLETQIIENESVTALGPAEVNHVAEGERLFSEGLVEEAKAMFKAATEECPGNAQAWNNLAVMAITENDTRQAENYLRRALEVKSDCLEARHNLAEIYSMRGQHSRAAKELSRVLEMQPGDLATIKRLAQIYVSMGEPEKAREILDDSLNMGAMKSFIDSLWLGIKYYALADEYTARDKLEKFTGAILKFLDGQEGRSRRWRLVSTDPDTGEDAVLEGFFDAFYYKETPSLTITTEGERTELVLTIGDNDDWDFFREVLRNEMRAEGGCLGDFTQTRKVLKRETRLAKYDLNATLQYFQDNVGPCDCHVLRAVMV
ncbi:hypothetical protein C4J81_08770 [Deltaproteobacteria bacterium Smac51]|nr:hypothetical protein C4J81_08770 [Deltaproteobacteria bacterium Smac51]